LWNDWNDGVIIEKGKPVSGARFLGEIKKNMMFYVIIVWSWKGQNNNIVIKKQIVSIYTPSIKLTPDLSFSSIKHLIELIAPLKTTNNNKNSSVYSILVIGLLVLLIFAKLTSNVNFLFNYTSDWINWNFKHFHLFPYVFLRVIAYDVKWKKKVILARLIM
jgi:hypothetical protein